VGWKGRYVLKIIMSGVERQVCFEENNEWGGKAGMD
jgi:hypothetical protein